MYYQLWNYIYGFEEVLTYFLCDYAIVKVIFKRPIKTFSLIIIINICCIILLNNYCMSGNLIRIYPVLIGLIIPLLSKEGFNKKTLISWLFIFISDIFNTTVLLLVSYLTKENLVDGNSYNEKKILYRCSFLLIILLVYMIRKWNNSKNDLFEAMNYRQFIFLFFNLLSWIVVFVIYEDKIKESNYEGIKELMVSFAALLAPVFSIVLSIIYSNSVKKISALQEKEKWDQFFMQSQKNQIEDIMQRDKELRAFRHDYRSHMIVIKEYAKRISEGNKEDSDKLFDYVNNFELSYIDKYNNVTTGVTELDAIVGELAKRCDLEKIKFETKGHLVIPSNIKVYDICAVVYNLFLNAIEASEKIEEEKRKIDITFSYFKNHISITVQNSCISGKMADSQMFLFTDKEDKVNHGIGIENVRKMINKYGGKVLFNNKDGIFKVEVYI